ncbi:hypothetical protein [Bradyrhizobium sp. 131]|uniref:hypothetical protein n=1 Tax=Bradyrhizobium sp. 131 TaxID=2782609 RepID=UPI0020004436|nr:hypothetical protein [Bradyrhizobium sp. 131]UPK20558.1 hypothetical protein IVA73_05885 [Bradyrhizobium sp. 131]UPK20589.1 hypothetical protein IVA73_06135 [Bradyrhizobium sp. 131]
MNHIHDLAGRVVCFTKTFPDVQLEFVVRDRLNLIREMQNGRVDLAVLVRHSRTAEGDLLRRANTLDHIHPKLPTQLPLALASSDCSGRDTAMGSLNEANRSFKLVLSSGTIAPIVAAVLAGVAIFEA